MIGLTSTTKGMCSCWDIQSGGVLIGLDGESAMTEAAGDWPLKASQPSFDVLTEIRQLLKDIPIEVKWKWIKGH